MQKMYEPIVKFVPGKHLGVLAVEHLAGYGSGVFRRAMTVYRAGAEGLVPLFSFPVRAYVIGWVSFQRHISGDVTAIPRTLTPGARFEVRFTVNYSADPSWSSQHDIEQDVPLFSHSANLVLEWHEDARLFVPSRESSTRVSDVESFFDDGLDEFVEHHEDELIGLVRNNNPLQRRWVMDAVERCRPSPSRERVRAALRENDPV